MHGTINSEIINTYGTKLIDIVYNWKEYTLYNVDYIAYVNNNILSIVIKSTIKEGNNPQRVTIQTYNYNLENDKQVSLEEMLELKGLKKADIQSKIVTQMREKNVNAEAMANQGYNVYVRDIRSEEYLIENITTYFLGEEGHLYIVFAYGNTNYTETMDVIIL